MRKLISEGNLVLKTVSDVMYASPLLPQIQNMSIINNEDSRAESETI